MAGHVPGGPATVGILRGEMAAIARRCGLSPEQVVDVQLAVSEAVTNVVLHAYPEGDGDVSGEAHLEAGALRIVIGDHGSGLAPRVDSPGLGLGMPMIATVSDDFEVHTDRGGTEVHMTFARPAAGDLTATG